MGQPYDSGKPPRELPPVAPPPRKVSQPADAVPEMSVFRGLSGGNGNGSNGHGSNRALPAVSAPKPRAGSLPPVSPPVRKPSSHGTLMGVGRPPPPRASRDALADSITKVNPNAAHEYLAAPPAPHSREDSGEIVGLDWDEEEESTHVFRSSHPPSMDSDSGRGRPRPSGRVMAPSAPISRNLDLMSPPSTDTLRLDGVDSIPQMPVAQKAPSMFPPPPPIPSITQARPMEAQAIPGIVPSLGIVQGPSGEFPRAQPQAPGPIAVVEPLPQPQEEVRDQAFVRLPSGNPHTATELAIKRPSLPAFAPSAFAPSASVPPPAPRDNGAKKWILGAAVAFALLSVVALAMFLFTRRPGSMQIDVRDAAGGSLPRAEVYVDGRPVCDATPCLVRDLDIGRHSVRVIVPNAPAIEPKTIEVEAGSVAAVSFTVDANQSTILVAGQPGIRLMVDGVDRGNLPARVTGLTPGRHEIKLTGDRYKPLDRVLELKAGETMDLGEQKLTVSKGRLTLAVKGEGVSITLVPEGTGGRGKALDPPFTTPIEIDTSTGVWRVVAKKADQPDFSQVVDFSDGIAEKTITVDFTKSPEAISLTDLPTTPTASATATAKTAATTPGPAPTAPPARTNEPSESASGTATLNINSIPASRVLLDGQPLGETPRTGVQVSPGTHTVTFIHPELGKKSISVKVGPGETKSAVAKLRSE